MPDGEVQAEISKEKARLRYKTLRPRSYTDRIKRAVRLALQGTEVKLAEITLSSSSVPAPSDSEKEHKS